MEFKPPIASRSTDELISIAWLYPEDYQELAIEEAKRELSKRNIHKLEYQKLILQTHKHKEKTARREDEYNRYKSSQSLTIPEIIYHTVLWPLPLVASIFQFKTIYELFGQGYTRKAYQALVLRVLGFILLLITINLDI